VKILFNYHPSCSFFSNEEKAFFIKGGRKLNDNNQSKCEGKTTPPWHHRWFFEVEPDPNSYRKDDENEMIAFKPT
jgi:hypothetical protein